MTSDISATLHATGDGAARSVACRHCDHALAPVGTAWKPAAVVRERPMDGAGGAAYQSAAHVVLRQFLCPGCGALLDTETAMSGDPFLDDILKV